MRQNLKETAVLLLAVGMAVSGCQLKTPVKSSVLLDKTDHTETDRLDQAKNESAWDDAHTVQLILSDTGTDILHAASDAVEITDGMIIITAGGYYRVTGSIQQGQLIIRAPKDAEVFLMLSDAAVTCSGSAALWVQSAGTVYLTCADGTVNTLTSTGSFSGDDMVDGAIFSKDKFIYDGPGTLHVVSETGHGIVVKDAMETLGGVLTIDAAEHAIQVKDHFHAENGSFTLQAGKDGIHVENKGDAALGTVDIEGGDFTIDAVGDGISASTLQISGGTFSIVTGGGSGSAPVKDSGGYEMWGNRMKKEEEQETSVSQKGIKAETSIIITDGVFSIDSCDDALHANGNLTISNGDFHIKAGDDGIHADDVLTISAGTVQIDKSYEGIEAKQIFLCGGKITVVSSDDGINAADGSIAGGNVFVGDPFAAEEGVLIDISGDTRLFVSAAGDGFDSNGDLYVRGGEIVIEGPENSANGALDYNGEAIISGGTLLAVGASGMAENFGTNSTQGVMLVTFSAWQEAVPLTLYSSDGEILYTYTPAKRYDSAVLSLPAIKEGNVYTLCAGETETVITMTSLVFGSDTGRDRFGGFTGGPDALPQNNKDGRSPWGGKGEFDFDPEGSYDFPPDAEDMPKNKMPMDNPPNGNLQNVPSPPNR